MTENEHTKVLCAIELLRNHNLWRRGDDTIDMAHPVDLGNAIEIAIGVMDRSVRAMPKMQKVDLDGLYFEPDRGWCNELEVGHNRALDDIKSKYGELYVEVK